MILVLFSFEMSAQNTLYQWFDTYSQTLSEKEMMYTMLSMWYSKSDIHTLYQQYLHDQMPFYQHLFSQKDTKLSVGWKHIDIALRMNFPPILLFQNFLSPKECHHLIQLGKEKMEPSQVVSHTNKGSESSTSRTSFWNWIQKSQDRIVKRIEKRIESVFWYPIANTEAMHILRYENHQEYKAHYDYFSPDSTNTPDILKRGWQRIGTLILYLHTPENGWTTSFPDIGMSVYPQQWNAVFFGYDTPTPSSKTLHSGDSVENWEKWIATVWFREKEFV